MTQNKTIQSPDTIILIASQFDELGVIACHSELRDQGLSVVLVSVMPGLVQSIRGISVYPDSYLSKREELVSLKKQQLIILAGGETCAAKTLSDPRTHQLVETILQQDGYVGVMAKADFLVKETGLFATEWASQVVYQGGEETAVFVQQLLNHIMT